MIASITTIHGEEYTGHVSGFVNVAHGKIHEPLASKNFGICLYMRIAPITFDTILRLEIVYSDEGNRPNKTIRLDLYKNSALSNRTLFFYLRECFMNKQFFK